MSKAAKKKKQEWTMQKPNLDNARKQRGICFTDLEDGECKQALSNTRKTLKIPMEPAMLCKLRTKKRPKKSRETDDETKGSNKIQKDTECMHRGGSRIDEKAIRINSTNRSHRGKRVLCDDPLQIWCTKLFPCFKR